jgi:hypothetical protein
MKYDVDLESDGADAYVASCEALGVSARGLTPSNALDAIRAEIRYHLELCPCSSVEDQWIELNVTE